MPVEKESRIGRWVAAVREGWPALRAGFDEWKDAVRENPVLIWQTPAIRYLVYGLTALIAVWVLSWGLALVRPPEVAPPAQTADFHVLCTDGSCGHHFVINKEFDFDDFPVACPKCKKKTGRRTMRCVSKTCRRRWVVPKIKDDEYHCPQCDAYLRKVD